MREHQDDTLTPDGAARRDQMIEELLVTMRQVHRGRRRRRAGAALLVALGLGAAGLWATGRPATSPAPPPTAQAPRITVRVIDDEELLRVLAEIGRPAGLVRSEGRVWLTADVTDAGFNRPSPPGPSL